MKHVLSADQFSRKDLDYIMTRAKEMEKILLQGGTEVGKGKILATLFYEPSTRTKLSFETAMYRLGGRVISESDIHFSSRAKGEILEDTIRIVGSYADIIAIRSKEKGEAALAAEYSPVPILNGGDGSGEHPTQSLLDLYTIQKYFPNLGNKSLNITFVGDLKYGRTVHSLSKILRHYEGVNITFVAPEEIQMPPEYVKKGDLVELDIHDEILKTSDVIYDTRIQKERFEDVMHYEKVKDAFVFDTEMVKKMGASSILMHPLPRVNEIHIEVDALPQAKYFEQAANGIPVRMALIAELLGL